VGFGHFQNLLGAPNAINDWKVACFSHGLHCGTMAGQFMNVQVIDAAVNCVYDVFAATPEEFRVIFAPGTDFAFIDEVCERHDAGDLEAVFSRLWPPKNPQMRCCRHSRHTVL